MQFATDEKALRGRWILGLCWKAYGRVKSVCGVNSAQGVNDGEMSR